MFQAFLIHFRFKMVEIYLKMELYTLYNCGILFPIYLLYKQNGRFLQNVNNFIKEAVQKVINRNTL